MTIDGKKAGLRLRLGVTLVELLVVLSIIAVLTGIVIPAVMRVRASADRNVCQNNLRQLGLALHSFGNVNRALPAGITIQNGKAAQPFLSWHARLLPFLDQEDLWKKVLYAYAEDRDFRKIPPHVHRSTVVPVFACPADPRTLSPSTAFTQYFQVAFTSYLGVWGVDYRKTDGVLFPDSSVRFTDIVDGTSNTLMVGERPPSYDQLFGWWYAGWGQNKNGSAEVVLGVEDYCVTTKYPYCPDGPYAFGSGKISNNCDAFHYWSPHAGNGANFAMADGSVRFLSYSAAPIMPALATRAGRETVELP